MNNETAVLVFIFIIKIIIIISLPLYLIFSKEKKQHIVRIITFFDIIFLSLFLVLKVLNNSYIVNSTISGIKKSFISTKFTDDVVTISSDPNMVEEIITNEFYSTSRGNKVYSFNNFLSPLSDKVFECDNKKINFKNIGNNITAISIMVSTSLEQNIDPIEILNKAIDNDLLDCNDGVSTDDLLDMVSNEYSLSYREVSREEAVTILNTGNIVLAEIDNNLSNSNISCGSGNIILYNFSNEGNLNILNPDDRDYDYICPDNTNGYGTIIKANSNVKEWDPLDIYSIAKRYIVLER